VVVVVDMRFQQTWRNATKFLSMCFKYTFMDDERKQETVRHCVDLVFDRSLDKKKGFVMLISVKTVTQFLSLHRLQVIGREDNERHQRK
jgi:hypothetical protein